MKGARFRVYRLLSNQIKRVRVYLPLDTNGNCRSNGQRDKASIYLNLRGGTMKKEKRIEFVCEKSDPSSMNQSSKPPFWLMNWFFFIFTISFLSQSFKNPFYTLHISNTNFPIDPVNDDGPFDSKWVLFS